MTSNERFTFRVGADENGLGARLGPLTVTAVLAQVSQKGARLLRRRLPAALRGDLNDSKVLVSCHDVSLAEAWARALVERLCPNSPATNPDELFRILSHHTPEQLTAPCPPSTRAQCWTPGKETFTSTPEQLARMRQHLNFLELRGVQFRGLLSSVVCNGRLETLKEKGINRFSADLHQMEELMLRMRALAEADIEATCGKVGGMTQYGRFFGPLSDRLHVCLGETAAESAYAFPRLGTVRFLRDADASDPLVMLASLVGKYVRELLMRRIAHYYVDHLVLGEERFVVPSGYHDPVSNRFVLATAEARRKLAIVDTCFQRRRESVDLKDAKPGDGEARSGKRSSALERGKGKSKAHHKKPRSGEATAMGEPSSQSSLFGVGTAR